MVERGLPMPLDSVSSLIDANGQPSPQEPEFSQAK